MENFFEAGMRINICCKAAMGQSADFPNIGMEIVEVSLLFYIVFDHLTVMVANF